LFTWHNAALWVIAARRFLHHMRIAILGGGTIGRLVTERVSAGDVPGAQVVAICGRSPQSRGAALAAQYSVAYVHTREALLALEPEVVLESASHQAVREHLVELLDRKVTVIVLSAGALADGRLRAAAETAAARTGALLYVPSGGIGGLDALKAACAAGVDEVAIQVAKPPAAWKGIAHVESLRVELDHLRAPVVLFDGSASEGVPLFPQNVNIAAVLSLAGIGFDRTRLRVVADPGLTHNTHTIRVSGRTGQFSVVLENAPAPENPKTAWLACYSALAALRELASPARYGT
jgi:aspartate dehydrogenase